MKLVVDKGIFTVYDFDGTEKHESSNRDLAIAELEQLGALGPEVEAALQDLAVNNNNTAHFGIKGTFMFTEKQIKGSIKWQ